VKTKEGLSLAAQRQMATVKARARPWRAIFALVLAAAAGIISSVAGRDFESWTGHDHAASKIVAASTAAASSGRDGATEKHQPAPGQQPPGGSSPRS
jgi:hypothetical protein